MALGYLYGLLSVAFSSLYHLLLKFGLHRLSALQAAFIETLFTLLFCLLYQRARTRSFKFQFNKMMLICGLLNSAGMILFCIGLKLLSPITVGLLGRTSIMFSIILSYIWANEQISILEVFLIILGFIGCYAFIYQESSYSNLAGVLVTLAYALFFAITNILTKLKLSKIPANDLLLSSRLITLLILLVYELFWDHQKTLFFDLRSTGFIALASFFGIFVGFNFYYAGLKRSRLSIFTMIRSTGPLFVAAYSWPFFPVHMTWLRWLGALILFLSVFALVGLDLKRKEQKR